MEKKWEDCPREDLNMIPRMKAAGYVPEFKYNDRSVGRTTPDNVPHDAVVFFEPRKNQYVYQVYSRKDDGVYSCWRVAEVDNGNYVNQRDYATLAEALEKETSKHLIGKRIRLVEMLDDPDPIPTGSEGVVTGTDDLGHIFVDWDCGRALHLIPGVDRYEII